VSNEDSENRTQLNMACITWMQFHLHKNRGKLVIICQNTWSHMLNRSTYMKT
jgi:hypothetical protein